MPRRVFITAAEVSGDKHAAQLVRSLKRFDPDLIVEGLGGPEMAAAGATVHRDTVSRAAMGWRGIFRAREVARALRWTRGHFHAHKPDLLIGVDSPSMNFHFAKVARAQGVPVLQYVAPQLWAWAPWRMKKLRRRVDHVACILPFEEEYFRRHGVNATFVGHPLFDELPADRSGGGGDKFPARPPVIGLLPGSRTSEAEANFPGLLDAAGRIRSAFPQATFLVPTTPATDPVVGEKLGARPVPWITSELNAFDRMVPRCDLCLTVSGTATLHVASFGVPMMVVYRVSRAAWNLAGRWLVPTRTFALVNVLAADPTRRGPPEHLVPEFVPWYGSGEPLANLAIEMLKNPDRLADQGRKLRALVASLDRPGASDATARLATEMMKRAAPAS